MKAYNRRLDPDTVMGVPKHTFYCAFIFLVAASVAVMIPTLIGKAAFLLPVSALLVYEAKKGFGRFGKEHLRLIDIAASKDIKSTNMGL